MPLPKNIDKVKLWKQRQSESQKKKYKEGYISPLKGKYKKFRGGIIKCNCGCGTVIDNSLKEYQSRYVSGHYKGFWLGKKRPNISGKNHYLYGKHRSDEVKLKVSLGNIGKVAWNKDLETPLEIKKKQSESKIKLFSGDKGKIERERMRKQTLEYFKKQKINPTEVEINRRKKISNHNSGEKNYFYGKHFYGEESPQWINGSSFEPYSPEFNDRFKEQIRTRDNYQCQECFVNQKDLVDKKGKHYTLCIHHIDYNKKNNNSNNLISLCNPDHIKTNNRKKRRQYTQYYQARMEMRNMNILALQEPEDIILKMI